MADYTTDPAVTVCFSVTIDGRDLGAFTSCDGLGVEVEVEEKAEGGNNLFTHKLPGRMKYTNVKLSRVINKDTANVSKWFASMGGTIKRTTAHIVARTQKGESVAKWDLQGVVPIRWTGPQMNVDSPKVATETLELAHHGFLPG
jgi:phage tail-like protein